SSAVVPTRPRQEETRRAWAECGVPTLKGEMRRRLCSTPPMNRSDTPGPAGPLLDVDPVAVELGERFRAAGHQLYLVGGAVRDLLLDRPARGELDFATDARPGESVRILHGWAGRRYLQGVEFGTVVAWKDDRD